MSEQYIKVLEAMCERESYWLRRKVETFKEKKFAIFPAGPTAQGFYLTLLNDYDIEADFFIDNNPQKKGHTYHDKPVKLRPWEEMPNFRDEYVVLISTLAQYYFQIVEQLEQAGIESYIYADAYVACQIWDRYKSSLNMLYDEKSKIAYLGAIYHLLTLNNSFIAFEGNQYFAHKEFTNIGHQIVVDAGAFTGDTLEEYVKRSMEGFKYYGFEPFDKAFKKLETRAKRLISENMLSDSDIILVPAGVGTHTEKIKFTETNSNMLIPNDSSSGKALLVYSLDDYFKDKIPFTLLKADIEGGELEMLKGASETIRLYKPKMTLCIYHSAVEFASIVEYIHKLVPEYKMAIRNHCYDYRETVLYCWV